MSVEGFQELNRIWRQLDRRGHWFQRHQVMVCAITATILALSAVWLEHL